MMALTLAAAAIAALASPGDPLEPILGQLLDIGGRCYRVSVLDVGPGGARYAWLVALEPPRGLLHLPASSLATAAPCSK